MRILALVLNAMVVLFFASFFGYTFLARQDLEQRARQFVTEKTLAHSHDLVDKAEQSLDSKLVNKLISQKQEADIRQEIAAYRHDPAAYVADLTRQPIGLMAIAKGNPLVAKVAMFKDYIRRFYNETLQALIADLQIFSFSNLCAGAFAFYLTWQSPTEIRRPIVWFSFSMFVAVLYCSYFYVDQMTFFRILVRAHMGWSYTLLMCVCIGALYIDMKREARAERGSASATPKSL